MITIHFFTDPYKDELIYSAISRYHFYTGNIDFKDTLEELFGKRSIIPSLEIGSNIEVLAQNLGDKYTAEYIISKHTIFPFYKPFLPKQRKEELIKEIKYQDGKGIYTRLGMVSGSICNKNGIFYCPCCAKVDIESFGETYIHREHQLQGVKVCPHDGSELKKYKMDKSNSSRIEFIRLDKQLIDLKDIRLVNNKHQDKLLKISKDAYQLIETDFDNVSKEKILEKYKNLLYQRGLATSSKGVKQIELYEEFINFYGNDFLEMLESGIDNDDEYNWLRVATRNVKRTVHPIRHLLLINFLEGDVNKFFKDINIEFEPFGKGPWPCLNKVSDHYKNNIVKTLKVTEDSKTRVPVGTFTCECGFVYSRKGADKYKIGRIKDFGRVWEDKLKAYLKEGKYKLTEVAKLMKCDPKTIIKFDRALGINYFKDSAIIIAASKAKPNIEDKTELYKEAILEVIKNNEGLTRDGIRKLCKKEYVYLYRKHKQWLFTSLPKKVRVENKRVNWDKRDNEYLALIKDKYKELISLATPIRITKGNIGKPLGIVSVLEKTIDKLPKTAEYLDKIYESVEAFQIRRCKNIINIKLENDEQIKLWEIQRLAGIRGEDFTKISEEILKYIEIKNSGGKYEQSSS